ncbi:hypothetical protein BC827DRAFT_641047 [Russula dissimulans]|nr:hypothetical protein BC827DRAFT_641047 [Russula dissimulans]
MLPCLLLCTNAALAFNTKGVTVLVGCILHGHMVTVLQGSQNRIVWKRIDQRGHNIHIACQMSKSCASSSRADQLTLALQVRDVELPPRLPLIFGVS